MSRAPLVRALACAALALVPALAAACPSCYGAADSPMIDGMNTAILAMVGIIAFVLAGVVAFFLMMRRRIARLEAGQSPDTYQHNKGALQWNSF